MRQWANANPGSVNDVDGEGETPLYVAVYYIQSPPLVRWLVKIKYADVNSTKGYTGTAALHVAPSLALLNVLLDCGADPALPDDGGSTPLMNQQGEGEV